MSRIVESLYQKYDLNEDFWNPGKEFTEFTDILNTEFAERDWNHWNQDKRDAFAEKVAKRYLEINPNPTSAFFDDLDDNNFHTYYRAFEKLLSGVNESNNEDYSEDMKLTEDYYILVPTENRYDEPIDVMKFAKKYGVFKTSDEAMDKMNELAPDRWDAFITYRLEESMKDKVKNIKLNEAFFDDSTYTEPIKFKINVSSTSRDDCDKVFKRMFNDKHIIRPEILIDNEDGSGEICFPGPNDLIDFIKQCLYEVTDKPSEYKLDIL